MEGIFEIDNSNKSKMMRKFSVLIFISIITVSCDNDIPSNEIPSVVANAFKSKFHHATDVEWENFENDFEVDFEINGIDHSARIDSSGNILGYKYDIDSNVLPSAIITLLETEYSKKKWEDPEILMYKQNSYYQMEMEGFIKDTKIVLDSVGNKIDTIKYWN